MGLSWILPRDVGADMRLDVVVLPLRRWYHRSRWLRHWQRADRLTVVVMVVMVVVKVMVMVVGRW